MFVKSDLLGPEIKFYWFTSQIEIFVLGFRGILQLKILWFVPNLWQTKEYRSMCKKCWITFTKIRDEKVAHYLGYSIPCLKKKVIFVFLTFQSFWGQVYYVFCVLAKTFAQFGLMRFDLETSGVLLFSNLLDENFLEGPLNFTCYASRHWNYSL